MQERGERGEGQGIYPPSSGKMRGQDNIIFFFFWLKINICLKPVSLSAGSFFVLFDLLVTRAESYSNTVHFLSFIFFLFYFFLFSGVNSALKPVARLSALLFPHRGRRGRPVLSRCPLPRGPLPFP